MPQINWFKIALGAGALVEEANEAWKDEKITLGEVLKCGKTVADISGLPIDSKEVELGISGLEVITDAVTNKRLSRTKLNTFGDRIAEVLGIEIVDDTATASSETKED